MSEAWRRRLGAPDPTVAGLSADAAARAHAVPEESFTWLWGSWIEGDHPDDLARLREAIGGGIVVDLGGGRAALGARLAAALGATAYADVDLRHGGGGPLDPARDLHDHLPEIATPPGLGVVRVRAEALDVAARLRDVDAFLVCGLDADVVPDPSWHRALAGALARALRPGGVVLWTESLVGRHLAAAGLRPLEGLALPARLAAEEAAMGGRWIGTGVAQRVGDGT